MSDGSAGVRLQKVLARAGVASRRAAEELIVDGRVSVDGVAVTELGTRVDPHTAVIEVDGVRIVVDDDVLLLALNKPPGVHTTMTDDRGRPCIGDLVRSWAAGADSAAAASLFHVGRLDADTEGLLLLTNDGELAHRLTHPSYEIRKTYVAEVDGRVTRATGAQLLAGIELDDGPIRMDSFRVRDTAAGRSMVELQLHEGRNRIVRRALDAVGHPVRRLVRTAVGDILLGDARPGQLRQLSRRESGSLYSAVGL